MVEEVKGFADHFSAFKRRWKLALVVFVVIFSVGAAVTMSLPDVFRSSAFILIEESEIPEELLRSTVTTYTTLQVTKLNERILTIANLIKIIEKYGLYAKQRESTPTELLAFKARESIAIEIQSRETVTPSGAPRPVAVGFTVAFEDESPELAQQVASELAGRYLEENVKVRSEQTTETANYLEGEVSRLEDEIAELETGMAQFKRDNSETLPSLNALNMQMMTRLDTELLNIERNLTSLEESRIGIEAQLALVEPTMPTRLADGSMVMAPQDQLKALQTQLSVYQSRYSNDHPDVVRTKTDIKSIQIRFGLDVDLAETEGLLREARVKLASAEERYTSSHPDVVRLNKEVEELEATVADVGQRRLDGKVDADNPAYIQLKSSLDRFDAEETAFVAERAELKRRMTDYESRLQQTPQVEKELASLTRVLSSTTNRYWVMRDKQFTAEIGETLETSAKGEQLILIEPARLPLKPFKPDRGAILALSFLFALVCGLGITQLADALDNSIRGAAAIINVQGVPPLVEVPYIRIEAENDQLRRLRKLGLAATPAVAIVTAIIVHFTVVPLDVIWIAALQRLGL
jgi:succinoglycan biosynthesis transport protein ExoP